MKAMARRRRRWHAREHRQPRAAAHGGVFGAEGALLGLPASCSVTCAHAGAPLVKLSAAQLGILGRWLDEGASYAPHWAYVAPAKVPLPEVRERGWPRRQEPRGLEGRLGVGRQVASLLGRARGLFMPGHGPQVALAGAVGPPNHQAPRTSPPHTVPTLCPVA